MDPFSATAGPLGASHPLLTPGELHSTTALLASSVQLAHHSLQDHIDDYADAHRWIDSFFDKIDGHTRAPTSHGQPRPGVLDLMKTPGRKRIAGGNSTNRAHLHPLASTAKKDPLATLLFPATSGPSPRSPAHGDKENATASSAPQRSTPRKMLSPLGGAAAPVHRLSPMRAVGSPAPSKQRAAPAPKPVSNDKEPEPVVKALDFAALQSVEDDEPAEMPVHDLSNVMEEEEEAEDEVDKVQDVSVTVEEEKADLSIIGEEEEEEEGEEGDESTTASAVTAQSTQTSVVASTSVIAETQFSQPAPASPAAAPVVTAPAALPLSPPRQQRTVSGASSVAPEADDMEDVSVPLNDAPSVLRSTAGSDALRSSLSASTVRTPGNSTSRFGALGSYSAARTGLGSSPPPTAPSTVGPSSSSLASSARVSTGGGGGARQINFVGLSKKKSLGLGLGLGRNWAASMGSSAANDSQGSIQSAQASQSTQATTVATASSSTASAHSVIEPAQSGMTTATGATKRKSLADTVDSGHKAPKVDAAPQTAQEQEAAEARKRREALTNRMQSIHNRQSNLGGRASNVAGPNAFASSIFGAPKQLGAPGSSLFHPASAAPATKPLLVSTSSSSILPGTTSVVNLASTTHGPDAGPASASAARRPSVMERVKSFEHNTTGQEHLHPPSPSKIPSAFFASSGPHSPRAMSPPPVPAGAGTLSPRGLRLASPHAAPVSPRVLTRSATSGLPLATFGSPKLGAPVGARSPPAGMSASVSAGAPLSISSILSPPASAPKPPQQQQQQVKAAPAPVPAVRSPVEAPQPKPAPPSVRSTTPAGSPPPSAVKGVAALPAKQQPSTEVLVLDDDDEVDEDDESEEDEEEEGEILSIRAINASTPASAVVEAEAAAARARAQAAAAATAAAATAAAEQAARDLEEQEADRERAALLSKRLPSLPEVRPPADDRSDGESDGAREEEEERSVVQTATKEDLGNKASPSKIVMPGTFGAAMVTKAKEASSVEVSEVEEDQGGEDDEEEDDDDEEDRTTMSMLSTATTTLNLSHQPFKPITKTAQLPKPAPSSKSSLASSVSSTAAFGLNRSAGASAASGIKKPVDTKVKSIQRAAAAAKKEKEEADRKNALKEQKRAAIAQKKLEDERKLKVEGLEKKRKEREEAASKAKAGIARMKQKPAGDDEPAKKRKIEPEPKVRPEQKKIGQPTRPLPASSSASASSLAQSQGRAGAMGPPALNKSAGPSGALNKPVGPSAAFSNPLSKSAGASSMVGQSFMSAKIRLPDSSAAPAALPPRPLAPTVPKPFSSAMRPPQPTQAPKVVEPQEPLQELPDIDSEYSDSDDEAHERKNAALPRWAQSPALAQALLDQQQVNPDEIFGPIPKLSIGDFFRNSASAARLRARTSSAQWDGTDSLTQTDLARYQRAMGYKSGLHLAASGPGQADAAHREGDQQHR